MLGRLKGAAAEGILLGVKYGLTLLVVAIVFMFIASDYRATRLGSQQGAAAFEYLKQAQAKARPPAKP